MTEDTTLTVTEDVRKAKRDQALLKAIGFDKLAPEQQALALNIAKRYELDPLLKHLVMIEGRVYITRDGLLHVAHRSKQLDGIEITEPVLKDGFWRVTASVYRKDMSRPFTYPGRYPGSGGNAKYAPEMAVKVSEVMALRRAFDVSAPAAEERWDRDEVTSESAAVPSLAERVAAKAAEATAVRQVSTPHPEHMDAEPVEAIEVCGDTSDPRLGPVDTCSLPRTHTGQHVAENGATWTTGKPA